MGPSEQVIENIGDIISPPLLLPVVTHTDTHGHAHNTSVMSTCSISKLVKDDLKVINVPTEFNTEQHSLNEQISPFPFIPHTDIPDTVFALSPLEYAPMLNLIWPLTQNKVWSENLTYKDLYDKVRTTVLPNYMSARIPVTSALRIPNCRAVLLNYPDNSLIDYLEYGWPLDYTAAVPPTPRTPYTYIKFLKSRNNE